jgi:N-acyl homoserine lactone hydrolase
MIDSSAISILRLGYATMPPEAAVHPGELVMVNAYLVPHPRGLLLFDTGIGEHPMVEDRYRPVRWSLDDALASAGVRLTDVTAVANCHLHFDHAGGNPRFANRPIFAQRLEYEAAGREGHTIPGLVDFAGASYELLDGEAEIWPGLRLLPTPGHTVGHQSLVVETRQGRVVLAGQAMERASDFAAATFAHELRSGGYATEASYPDWIGGIAALEPVQVLFAHDTAHLAPGAAVPPAG